MSDNANHEPTPDPQVEFQLVIAGNRARLLTLIAAKLGGDRDAAEDVLQEAFLVTWRMLQGGTYDPQRGRLTTLITRVANNIAANDYRERIRRRTSTASDILPGVEDYREDTAGADALDPEVVRETVRSAIRGLPNPNLRAVAWQRLNGQSYASIAKDLGTTPGTVRSWAMRAWGRLAQDAELVKLQVSLGGADGARG